MHRFVSAGLFAASALLGLTTVASAADTDAVMRSGSTYYKAACPRMEGLVAHCAAKIVTDAKGNPLATNRGERVSGFGPPDLDSAYNITTSGSSSTVVAIVDAFGYDNAEADLGVYRANYRHCPRAQRRTAASRSSTRRASRRTIRIRISVGRRNPRSISTWPAPCAQTARSGCSKRTPTRSRTLRLRSTRRPVSVRMSSPTPTPAETARARAIRALLCA